MCKLGLRFATLLAVCVCIYGCGSIVKNLGVGDGENENVASAIAATWWDGPKVRPGVGLIIQVGTSATQPFKMDALVDQKGEITLPLLLQKPVKCDGLSLEALKETLVKEYSVYYRQPQITVTFAPFDPRSGVSPWGTVTVLGEVNNPGPVNMPSTMDLTVTKVLQTAGGLKQFADRRKIQVTRCDRNGAQTKYMINLNEIGKDGRFDKDITLKAGDVVYVYETWY